MALFRIPTHDILWGPAPIDWCEPNNPETNPWGILEYHNTWSNGAYVLVGTVNIFNWALGKSPRDPLLFCFCVFAIMTGVTSAWFHATLLYVGQKSDEFFENATLLALLYSHLFPLADADKPSTKLRYIYFGFHAVLLGVGVFCIPELFCEIHLLCAVLASKYTGRQRCNSIKDSVARERSIKNNHRSLMWAALGFAFWIVDMLACNPFVQQLHLHAFAWHWLTAMGLHMAFSGTITMNQVLQEQVRCKQQ